MKLSVLALASAVAFGLAVAGPTGDGSAGEPLLDTRDEVAIPALPETLTAAQMSEISTDGLIDFQLPTEVLEDELVDAGLDLEIPEAAAPVTTEEAPIGAVSMTAVHAAFALNRAQSPSVVRAGYTSGGDRCFLDPGIMWSRSSGSGYRYGTVGSKPRLHSCTAGVRKTGIHSDVYRWNGWWWAKVAGTFNSYGTGNMEQKSVAYVCANKSSQLYQVITTGWGTNSKGQTGVGRDATPQTRFSCG